MDKLEIAQARLFRAVVGFFEGESNMLSIDHARATSEILRGIRDHCVKFNLIKHQPLLSDKTHSEKIVRKSYERTRRLSNFAKHADRDAAGTQNYSPTDTILAISHACVDMGNMLGILAKYDLVEIIADENLIEKDPDGPITRIEKLISIFLDYAKGIRSESEIDSNLDLTIREIMLKEIDELNLKKWKQFQGFDLRDRVLDCYPKLKI